MKNEAVRKYDYIDALRGIAIIGVILVHTAQWISPSSEFFYTIAKTGSKGVQLFFVASALTLFLSMSTRRKKEAYPNISFFIRRFFRIAPAFYGAIIFYFIYIMVTGKPPIPHWAPNGIDWWVIPSTIFFVHGIHPESINSIVPGGWSIAVEMTFYMVAPFLFKKLKDIKATVIFLILSIVLAKILSINIMNYLFVIYPEHQEYLVQSYSAYWFPSQLPIFVIGILLYHCISIYPSASKVIANSLLAISLLSFASFLMIHQLSGESVSVVSYGLLFFIFALSLHYWPNKLFVNKFTMLIGKLSFSLYLSHFIIIGVLKTALKKMTFIQGDLYLVMMYVLVLAISVLVSYASYNLIEKPGMNLGKHIIKRYFSTKPTTESLPSV